MKRRVMVRAGAAMLMSLVSVIGLLGVGAAPATAGRGVVAMAGPRVMHVTATQTLVGSEFVDLVPRGGQCLILVNQTTTLAGDLQGTAETVRPSEIRFFATCDEVGAVGGAGIPSTYSAVTHYVGVDGDEATMRTVGWTDSAGDIQTIVAVRGDLNGLLHETGSVPPPGSALVTTLEGILVARD